MARLISIPKQTLHNARERAAVRLRGMAVLTLEARVAENGDQSANSRRTEDPLQDITPSDPESPPKAPLLLCLRS
jgi:hypothetical protein